MSKGRNMNWSATYDLGETSGHSQTSKPVVAVVLNSSLQTLFTVEKPPTILLRHQLGPIAQSNDGKLIVYPGTILHMECLWIRRFGTPKWNISHEYRQTSAGPSELCLNRELFGNFAPVHERLCTVHFVKRLDKLTKIPIVFLKKKKKNQQA